MLTRALHNLAAITVCLAVSTPAMAGPQPEAMDAFKARHEAVIKLVRKKASSKKLQKEVDSLLDYNWIAQASLGGAKKYEKRCEPRCDEFENLLTKLIREAYLKRIRMADKGNVEYLGEQKRPQASKVNTKVTFKQNGKDQSVEIAYVMHQVSGDWQVRDFITDGVSLARNYKYEFNKILREQGIDGLIARLETKIAEVAKNK
jgi:phospholipid transport system substrate-binding protein